MILFVGQGIKWIITTAADGTCGPIMAVIGDKDVSDDYTVITSMDDIHPYGGVVDVCVCKSRAGSPKMWVHYMERVRVFSTQQMNKLQNSAAGTKWSKQTFCTLDGEAQQLFALLNEEFIVQCAMI